MIKATYIVQVQGWGDNEDEFYNMGACDSLEAAEMLVEDLIADWESNGGLREDVVYQIEKF